MATTETPPRKGAVQRWGALDARIGFLESKLKKRDVWDIIGTLSPFMTGIVIFAVSFLLKDSVDQALRREQLHLSSVKDMQELVLALRKADVTPDSAAASALTLVAFGHHAIPSLLSVLETADDVRAPAAEEALSAIAVTEPTEVCRPMIRILQDTTGHYSFVAHEAALRIIASAQCDEAKAVVERYQKTLDSVTARDLPTLGARFKEQSLGSDMVKELKDQARRTAEAIAHK